MIRRFAWVIAAVLLPLSSGIALARHPHPSLTITFNPQTPSLPQTSPSGTAVSTVTAAWSDGMPFTGTLAFDAPYYDDGGTFALSGKTIIVSPLGNGLDGDGGTIQNMTIVAAADNVRTTRNLALNVFRSGGGGGAMVPPTGYTTSQLIVEDQFASSSLDTTKWNPWMGQNSGVWNDHGAYPFPYSGGNCDSTCSASYDKEFWDPYPYGYSTSVSGNRLVGGSENLALIASPNSHFSSIGPTWGSSAISGTGKLMILPSAGGYVQWRAKMPDSRYGGWGVLWMLPEGSGAGGAEMDIQESGYTACGASVNSCVASHWWGAGGAQQFYTASVDLTAGYHIYGIKYLPNASWTVYLDGVQIQQWTGAVGSAAYEVIVNLQMLGPTTADPRPTWHTLNDSVNHPGPFELDVNDVQIYHN